MAATLAGTRLTERHRTQQVSLRAVFLAQLHRMWPLLDPTRLDATAAAWLDLIVDLIVGFRDQSADLSLRYYGNLRAVETGDHLIDLTRLRHLAPAPNRTAIRASLVATGPAAIKQAVGREFDLGQVDRSALVAVSGASSRHVLNGGRDMLDTAIHQDKTAIGYARVTSATPCSWCAMLASRGPVYNSRASAAFTTARSDRGTGNGYHDHCACTVEPVFRRGGDWPGRAREFEQLWIDSTAGKSGKEARNAFRRAYDAQARATASS